MTKASMMYRTRAHNTKVILKKIIGKYHAIHKKLTIVTKIRPDHIKAAYFIALISRAIIVA
ncbi:MAG: hypothetical protein A3F67_09800 [Verrucomicrobia bacterium RIFCSPHIGHO2_12_FULL_41_10]|nr:MAG: hypothetical protein A3F67_09800 [Verrucomicrobia bacterium RIFCSPHIGHO2_12_FULL_41_10]